MSAVIANPAVSRRSRRCQREAGWQEQRGEAAKAAATVAAATRTTPPPHGTCAIRPTPNSHLWGGKGQLRTLSPGPEKRPAVFALVTGLGGIEAAAPSGPRRAKVPFAPRRGGLWVGDIACLWLVGVSVQGGVGSRPLCDSGAAAAHSAVAAVDSADALPPPTPRRDDCNARQVLSRQNLPDVAIAEPNLPDVALADGQAAGRWTPSTNAGRPPQMPLA